MLVGHARHMIHAGDWVSEPVLWTTWSHVGSVRAKAESKLIVLTSETFRTISLDFKAALPYVTNYAERYVRWLNKQSPTELTDLAHQSCDYAKLAYQARRREALHISRRVSVSALEGGPGLPTLLPVTPDGEPLNANAEDERRSTDSDASDYESKSETGSKDFLRVHPDS